MYLMHIFFLIVFLLFFFIRKDLRREMIWAGFLALPVLLIKPLISNNFFNIAANNGGLLFFMLQKAALGFLFGGLASVIYELSLHQKITPKKHPHRNKMLVLLLGPILFLLFIFVFKENFITSIISAFVLDIILILIIRRDLIWDMIFSGAGMGSLYLLIFFITYRGLPGDFSNFWFTENMIGLTILSIPVEEFFAVALFGALWGPIYVAIKDFGEKNES